MASISAPVSSSGAGEEGQSSPPGSARAFARVRGALSWIDLNWFDPLGLVGIVLFLGIWWWVSTRLPPSRLVSPLETWQNLRDNFFVAPRLQVFGLSDAGYWPTLQYTIRNVAKGVVVGSCIGVFLGLVSARSWLLRAILDPVVLVLGTVPILIAAPFFLLWFGILPFTQALLVGLYSAVIMLIFSQRAVENLDPVFEERAETLGASGAVKLRTVLVPSTVPELLGGLRIAFAGAWGLETFAELLGARDGIGQSIAALANLSNVPGLLACVVMVAGAAIVFDAALVIASAFITRWK